MTCLPTIIMMYFSAFYMFEKGINTSVKTYFDAIWWSFITVTSVGYGDIYPCTTAGRVIGMFLTLCGMGLFSLITAELSGKFLSIIQGEKNQKTRVKFTYNLLFHPFQLQYRQVILIIIPHKRKKLGTPKHGSWLNIAEIELSVMTGQCLGRRIPSIEELASELSDWEHSRNSSQKGVDWQFTTDDARYVQELLLRGEVQ